MRSTTMLLISLAALPIVAGIGRSQGTSVSEDQAKAHAEVLATIAAFKKKDPGMQKFFDSSVGYAVLPTVGKVASSFPAAPRSARSA